MNKNGFKKGYVYIIKDIHLTGKTQIAIFWGRTNEFPCCVCGKGSNAYRFDWPYRNDVHQLKEAIEDEEHMQYENPCYGKEHLPELVKCLGKYSDLVKQFGLRQQMEVK